MIEVPHLRPFTLIGRGGARLLAVSAITLVLTVDEAIAVMMTGNVDMSTLRAGVVVLLQRAIHLIEIPDTDTS